MAPISSSDILADIETPFAALEANFEALYAAATNDEERLALKNLLIVARETYWRAAAQELSTTNSFINDLVADLREVNQSILNQLSDIQHLSNILVEVTDAVRLAAAIVTLAG